MLGGIGVLTVVAAANEHDMTNKKELWNNSFTSMSKSIQPILSKYMEQKF